MLRLPYLALTGVFAFLRLLPTSNTDKEIEILVLRHQLTIPQRQISPPRIPRRPARAHPQIEAAAPAPDHLPRHCPALAPRPATPSPRPNLSAETTRQATHHRTSPVDQALAAQLVQHRAMQPSPQPGLGPKLDRQVERGVTSANWQFRVDGAAERRVGERGEDAPVHRADGVVVPLGGHELEDRPAVADVHGHDPRGGAGRGTGSSPLPTSARKSRPLNPCAAVANSSGSPTCSSAPLTSALPPVVGASFHDAVRAPQRLPTRRPRARPRNASRHAAARRILCGPS
jgi:hypothetical protein